MARDRDDDTLVKLIDTRIQLNMEIDKDEMYWEQRARANWLQLGDKNSAFFHKHALVRRRINTITRLETEDERDIFGEIAINKATSNYFQNLFSSWGIGNLSHLLKCKDVENFCLGILNEGRDINSINITDIVLIPKLPNPTSLVNFRTINLYTVLYKIMAKVITNRLQGVIGECIDKAQSAFIPRRLLTDNVLVSYELLHTLRQKRIGKKRLMAVKLDMSKAYDRVEWAFLKKVMIQMGFAVEWVTLIMKCISTVSYTVSVNGRR
ncbi:uncharacterized protein [Gossypium hirsutum]|uniref:Reverse transcriptase domain-containing protein n=1 Tax=Gossypium hirsutum TaxID=3635 RepID=A0A1U8IIY3_GOSHI|nr:uncharacterized protein LOC107895580 [Gossypium hirsutum]